MGDVFLSVGQVARRSGLPISTLHFYERKGLINAERNGANHRVYRREILRRVAVIKIAQSAGIPLVEIGKVLANLPVAPKPGSNDWARISEVWHTDLTRRIDLLTSLRDRMAKCIGCGCLSVKSCPLFNKNDHLAEEGPGARIM
jgi:MerR family redox-sensitive transcriptional activator SoxR